MDMGITKNSEIYVRKVAPLGDPVEITVRGYELSLRRDDAESVEVVTVYLMCMQNIGKTRLLSPRSVDSDNTSAGK